MALKKNAKKAQIKDLAAKTASAKGGSGGFELPSLVDNNSNSIRTAPGTISGYAGNRNETVKV